MSPLWPAPPPPPTHITCTGYLYPLTSGATAAPSTWPPSRTIAIAASVGAVFILAFVTILSYCCCGSSCAWLSILSCGLLCRPRAPGLQPCSSNRSSGSAITDATTSTSNASLGKVHIVMIAPPPVAAVAVMKGAAPATQAGTSVGAGMQQGAAKDGTCGRWGRG